MGSGRSDTRVLRLTVSLRFHTVSVAVGLSLAVLNSDMTTNWPNSQRFLYRFVQLESGCFASSG
jgi:hypothetical protein